MTARVPVTLVTGFLGAGKTTLLRHLLAERPATRFALVENEFGDVGLDGDLLDGGDVVFEINEGCVCCTVRDDLIDVFVQLGERGNLDHVLIEASGLAEPVPVMRVFDDPRIARAFRLEGVVAVVDAAEVEHDLQHHDTCAEQLAYADVLVLNKADRVEPGRLDAIEDRLERLNPLAQVVRSEQARIDPEAVLAVGGHDLEATLRRRAATLARQHEGHGHGHGHDHDHDAHEHDHGIGSVALEIEGDLDIAALDRWLGELVRREGLDVLRMKGLIAVVGQGRRFAFHGVRSFIDVRPDRPWGPTELRRNRLVFIGRGLDRDGLQAELARCLHPVSVAP